MYPTPAKYELIHNIEPRDKKTRKQILIDLHNAIRYSKKRIKESNCQVIKDLHQRDIDRWEARRQIILKEGTKS